MASVEALSSDIVVGALAGAELGSVVPIIGTAVGAVAGAIAGVVVAEFVAGPLSLIFGPLSQSDHASLYLYMSRVASGAITLSQFHASAAYQNLNPTDKATMDSACLQAIDKTKNAVSSALTKALNAAIVRTQTKLDAVTKAYFSDYIKDVDADIKAMKADVISLAKSQNKDTLNDSTQVIDKIVTDLVTSGAKSYNSDLLTSISTGA